uniref:Protein phosphatase methylesterase 1 n=2 Tax=Talaromyces marneffei PM1 TaxID=1077442 RepID=A0A093UP01_TALMA
MEFVQTSPETKIHLRLVKESSISDSSPLLVFLHYWGGSSSTWYKLTSPDSPTSLSARYPSISINNRGWGQSTGPTAESGATGKDYSIAPLAQDLVAVLQSLATNEATASIAKDNGIVLVGHSMGAKVALAALEKLSDDILALVKGLVLVAPAPPTPLILPPRRALAGNALAKEGWIAHGMQEDLLPGLDRIAERPRVKDIKVSVLAGEFDVVEQKDRVQSDVVQNLIARGFNVGFSIVKGAKHLIPLEHPEAVSRALDDVLS